MGIGVNIAAQTLLFLKSVALGACLMLLYDVFRILRLAAPTPAAVVLAQDIVYFAVCAVATFLFLVSANYGEVRVFALIGEGLGALLCFLTVSQALMACSKAIIAVARRLLRLIWLVLLRPVYLLIRLIARGIVKIVDGMGFLAKKSLRKANYGLKRRRIMLYNLIVSSRRDPRGDPRAKPRRGRRGPKPPPGGESAPAQSAAPSAGGPPLSGRIRKKRCKRA